MSSFIGTPRTVNKRRDKITALPLYYSGHLLKKYTREKVFKSVFTELRGSTLFFYTDEKSDTYSEKLELQSLREMTVDNSERRGVQLYTLKLLNEEVQLKVDNIDVGEEWRGFIMTVAMLEVPSTQQLLPGQILRLVEVLELERQRTATLPSRPFLPNRGVSPSATYMDVLHQVPPCFFSVTREEAQQMLESHPENGNIILRPAADRVHYAVTMRQLFPSGPVTKHYRVRSEDSGLVIELDSPVVVSTLSDVLQYFAQEASHHLRPYTVPRDYDTTIVLPPERSAFPVRPLDQTKTTPCAQVAPVVRPPLPPPLSPASLAQLEQKQDKDSEYVELDALEKDGTVEHKAGGSDVCFKNELLKTLQKRREIRWLKKELES